MQKLTHTHTETGKHTFSLLLLWEDAVFGTANNCPKNNQLSAYKYEMSCPEQVQAKATEGQRERERYLRARESEFVDVDFVV